MNDIELNDSTEDSNSIPDELTVLKHRADMMGLEYHHKIGIDKLRAKIEARIAGEGSVDDDDEENEIVVSKKVGKLKSTSENGKVLTAKEYREYQFINRQNKAKKLERIRITCLNPNKKEWEGEIISVGSAKLGTIKKFVKYDVPWHVPHIILQELRNRKFSQFYSVASKNGVKIRKGKLVNEFAIEVMTPLTQQERQDLAKQQALAAGQG